MADPLRNGSVPNFAHPFLPAAAFKLAASPMHNSFRLDEGYSEDTRSQAGSEWRSDSRMGELPEPEPSQSLLPDWVSSLSEYERSEFAYQVLRSLRTSSIADIVDRLYPLLHIDPVNTLPPEITFEIFSYLDPQTLLRASTLSRAWRTQAMDARLWQRLFGSEGWTANAPEVKAFEEKQRARQSNLKGKTRARGWEEITDSESKSPRKRVRERPLFGDDGEDTVMTSSFDSSGDIPSRWGEQHGAVEADEDEKMEDVELVKAEADRRIKTGASEVSMEDIPAFEKPAKKSRRSGSPASSSSSGSATPSKQPLLIYSPGSTEPRLNWQYLYKQKRRLEENWISGNFTNFQLPHPSHPKEAHSECVYTIQYSSKHLVSGSRDKTVRIWNLDTQRLMVPPLEGHEASVLCLQFDDRPNQDIVISGGSDCHVIIWRFSTGEMIRKMSSAHAESVLNLRFDDRYLVTCSKDKTIKVWNREAILPTDDAYPAAGQSASARFPSYILNVDNIIDNKLALKPLKEYSLLMTLHGHTAAVNAIQILDSQIVSASGDRHVKVWDVKTGICLKTLPGHQKGIACVQFDGRRIVSGSSDETVRIFDRTTGAEVACLRGHANLVRTVQARFGDIPGGALDDEAEAKAIDRKYFAANLKASGGLSNRELTKEQRRNRNAGSKDPNDVFAVGAKLPPGGGGSRWARIVSGSYDETVIIWKRNPDGKWVPAHQLYQWQAVLNAGGQPRFSAQPHRPGHGPATHAGALPGTAGQGTAHQQAVNMVQAHASALVHQAQAQLAQAHASIGFAQHIVNQHNQHNASPSAANVGGASNNAGAPSSNAATNSSRQSPASSSSSASPAQPHQQQQQTAQQAHAQAHAQVHAQAHTQAQHQANAMPPVPPIPHQFQQQHHALPHHPTQQAGPANGANPQPQQQPQQVQGQLQQTQPHPPGHHHHPPHAHPAHGNVAMATQGTNSRVFKLQFDSRRIICCSQDPTIVGWDFANGDPKIIAASRFFGEDW